MHLVSPVIVLLLGSASLTFALDGLGGGSGGSKSGKGGSKRRDRQRRLDTAEHVVNLDDIVSNCGSYDYETFLFVEDHIFVGARPLSDARAKGCPMFVAHGVFAHDKATGYKEVLQWQDANRGSESFPEQEALRIVSFRLEKLFHAYNAADATAEGFWTYDPIVNHCGSFAVDMASQLGVEIDGRIKSFVVRRLLQSSSRKLITKIRSSKFYPKLVGKVVARYEGDDISDEKVLELLVDYNAA